MREKKQLKVKEGSYWVRREETFEQDSDIHGTTVGDIVVAVRDSYQYVCFRDDHYATFTKYFDKATSEQIRRYKHGLRNIHDTLILTRETMLHGEYYRSPNSSNIFRWDADFSDSTYAYNESIKKFYNSKGGYRDFQYYRLATAEEKARLEECAAAGEFVPIKEKKFLAGDYIVVTQFDKSRVGIKEGFVYKQSTTDNYLRVVKDLFGCPNSTQYIGYTKLASTSGSIFRAATVTEINMYKLEDAPVYIEPICLSDELQPDYTTQVANDVVSIDNGNRNTSIEGFNSFALGTLDPLSMDAADIFVTGTVGSAVNSIANLETWLSPADKNIKDLLDVKLQKAVVLKTKKVKIKRLI